MSFVKTINSNGIISSLIIAVILLLIMVFFFPNNIQVINSTQRTSQISDLQVQESEKPMEKGKIGETILIDDLEYRLKSVTIGKVKAEHAGSPNAESNAMNIMMQVTNKGESTKRVSSFCGTLLFADNSQYTFDAEIGNPSIRGTGYDYYLNYECYSLDLVPGATVELGDKFYFSDTFYRDYISFVLIDKGVNNYRLYHDKAISWDEAKSKGSRITYVFTQDGRTVQIEFDTNQILPGEAKNIFSQWQGYYNIAD